MAHLKGVVQELKGTAALHQKVSDLTIVSQHAVVVPPVDPLNRTRMQLAMNASLARWHNRLVCRWSDSQRPKLFVVVVMSLGCIVMVPCMQLKTTTYACSMWWSASYRLWSFNTNSALF
jgi:hypothetical protein